MREDNYIVVEWPECQELMVLDGFRENSYLINDEQGMNDFGSSAYFVNAEWLEKATATSKRKIWLVSTLIEYSDDCPSYQHQVFNNYSDAIKMKKSEIEQGMFNFDNRKGEVLNNFPTFYEYREEDGQGLTVVVEEFEI